MAAIVKGSKPAPKAFRSTMETLIITPEQVNEWRTPPFQRPIRVNAKVQAIAEEMKCDGTAITGILTLGKLEKETALYIVDGQHRAEAFKISGMPEIIADIRIVHFDSMAEMAEEFVRLNTAIVRMRPDDLLRGIVPSLPHLQRLMRECTYIGYDHVRLRGASGPLVSLAALLRCWIASNMETPTNSSGGMTITGIANSIDGDSVGKLIRFMDLAHDAWGRDPEYYRLWGGLNLTLCMWMYRRLVLDTVRRGSHRAIVMTESQFKNCLMALSASGSYIDWLTGRLLNDRDRSPGLIRMKQVFSKRLADLGVDKPYLPSPAWASK